MDNIFIEFMKKHPDSNVRVGLSFPSYIMESMISDNLMELDYDTALKIIEWDGEMCATILENTSIPIPQEVITQAFITSASPKLLDYIDIDALTDEEIEQYFQTCKDYRNLEILQSIPMERVPDWYPMHCLVQDPKRFDELHLYSRISKQDMISFWDTVGKQRYESGLGSYTANNDLITVLGNYCKEVYPDIDVLKHIVLSLEEKSDLLGRLFYYVQYPISFKKEMIALDCTLVQEVCDSDDIENEVLDYWYELYGNDSKSCKWYAKKFFISKFLTKMVSLHGDFIQHLTPSSQSEELQLIAIKQDVQLVKYMKKPCNAVLSYIEEKDPSLALKYREKKEKALKRQAEKEAKKRELEQQMTKYLVTIKHDVADEGTVGRHLLVNEQQLNAMKKEPIELGFGNIEYESYSFGECATARKISEEEYNLLKRLNIEQEFGDVWIHALDN